MTPDALVLATPGRPAALTAAAGSEHELGPAGCWPLPALIVSLSTPLVGAPARDEGVLLAGRPPGRALRGTARPDHRQSARIARLPVWEAMTDESSDRVIAAVEDEVQDPRR